MDAFISHSSANAAMARRVEVALAEQGIDSWLDDSDIRVGTLLRNELQGAIEGARVVVLLWSKPASRSRWVAAELLTAYHLGRFVVPCVLDGSALPSFLENTLHLPLSARTRRWIEPLVRAVKAAPRSANPLPRVLSAESPELRDAMLQANDAQHHMLAFIGRRELDKARSLQGGVDAAIAAMRKLWPLESVVLNLAGYNEKNRYMLRHWDAIQAGRPPKNRLLERAERCFFDALFADPNDASALNGLGNVLLYSRDFDAAKFFVRRAIAAARAAGFRYEEAEADLALIERAR